MNRLLKAPYSSKIDISFIQERFNKLITDIIMIRKYGIWQPVKFQLVIWIKTEMIFYGISEFMLATLIQKYDKSHFIFDPVQEPETN